MCLKANRLKPFTATKDIRVFKALKKADSGYVTLYQETPVNLNTMFEPSKMRTYESLNWGDSGHETFVSIENGYIHAFIDKKYLDLNDINDNIVFVEAIIPCGTSYHIGTNMLTVCAEKLFITDKFVKYDDLRLSREEKMTIVKPLFDEITNNGVSSGWLLKSDKTFVSPSDYDENMKDDIIGIVGFNKDGEKYVLSLEQTEKTWKGSDDSYELLNKSVSYEEAYDDYNGKEYTDNVKDAVGKNEKELPAFRYCLEYQTKGTEKGDWYLPACGELHEAICKHQLEINAVLWVCSYGVSVYTGNYYWSSSEYSSYNAMYVGTFIGRVDYNYKGGINYVRAFLRV